MDAKPALRWSGYYFVLTTLAAVVGAVFVGLGYLVGFGPAYEAYASDASTGVVVGKAVPGVVLALIGLAAWRLGKAWAFYRTFTAAVEEQLSETYDTERVKSDILTVLDDRLADMQQDLQGMHRSVRDVKRELGEGEQAEFDFGD